MSEVGCAGILVEDTFCGPLPQNPPAGQLVAVDRLPVRPGGCAANVAIDLAKQGVAVDIIGCVGRDGAGAFLKNSLAAQRVGCSQLIEVDAEPTSKTVILLVKGEDRRYIHSFGANRLFTVRHIQRDWVARLKVFYLGGLFVLPGVDLRELAELLQFCRANGVITVLDVVLPAGCAKPEKLIAILPHVDYFLPNHDEARLLTGCDGPTDQMRGLLAAGANTVIITQGEAGVLASRGKELWRAPACQINAIDPSGAGDAFAAGVITGILRAWDLTEILRYASALGASATRAIGTTDGVFTTREAQEFVRANPVEICISDI
jgi:sugar/nucleoside kinase (ribokinase family)